MNRSDECKSVRNATNKCPKKSVSWLPTRVIDVGQLFGSSPLRLHVCEHNEQARYAALSYCWGVEQQVITTTGSIAAFDGFIREVQPLDGALMPFRLPNHGECSIKLVPVTHLPYPGTHSDHDIHVLDTRGWTLQEFLLSPRLLLFSHTEVLWQCQQVQVDPVLPSSRQYHPEDVSRLPSSVFGLQSSDNVFNTKEERARIGISFMRNYSRRQFTLSEDRWYAMAGIIDDLSQVWQDACLAGHWKSCLAESLAWFCVPLDPPVPLSHSVPAYTAPLVSCECV
jgi:hypothetical protein